MSCNIQHLIQQKSNTKYNGQFSMFRDSHAAMTWMVHLDPGRGQQLARALNEYARALHTQTFEARIHWVLEHSRIPGYEDVEG